MFEVKARVLELSDFWRDHAADNEAAGQITDEVAAALRSAGVMRMLQPKQFGGYECHPRDYFETLFELGTRCASTGWVAGVVGVHAHELAQTDQRLQEEVWGENEDTWVASPYAPMGRAKPVEGGYIFNGRWSFSSGTDQCQWVMIGGLILGPDGQPDGKGTYHFCLPRGDYEIVEDSWNVMGLRGTGSKDLIVRDAFVPAHRVIDQNRIVDGTAGRAVGLDNPLYSIPRQIMFSGAITASTLAICNGVLQAYIDHSRARISRLSGNVSQDPNSLALLGEAAADIQASVQHFLWDIDRVYDVAASGETISKDLRIEVRRNQVNASARAVRAADRLFVDTGGAALHTSHPIQRMWRDAHAAMNHMMNTTAPVYVQYGLNLFGHELPPTARY
ncbi:MULTISPECIES: acyl-CoA dehydrogenase family protein [Rhodococcus]|uniref:hydroxylase n=1 Tax=Rhodococcus TaxID=1827 RepID=UPI00132EABD6|nr:MULTISPECIES: hydroxylase [Rhodococcus]QHG80719.1 hydroxylase [Rhodococcus rhodochrous]QOH55339.1 hydroxylase [Rhodococcus rhodochrous]WAL47342.1 hydroxylase [Rhodococcus pyridinivorans]